MLYAFYPTCPRLSSIVLNALVTSVDFFHPLRHFRLPLPSWSRVRESSDRIDRSGVAEWLRLWLRLFGPWSGRGGRVGAAVVSTSPVVRTSRSCMTAVSVDYCPAMRRADSVVSGLRGICTLSWNSMKRKRGKRKGKEKSIHFFKM